MTSTSCAPSHALYTPTTDLSPWAKSEQSSSKDSFEHDAQLLPEHNSCLTNKKGVEPFSSSLSTLPQPSSLQHTSTNKSSLSSSHTNRNISPTKHMPSSDASATISLSDQFETSNETGSEWLETLTSLAFEHYYSPEDSQFVESVTGEQNSFKPENENSRPRKKRRTRLPEAVECSSSPTCSSSCSSSSSSPAALHVLLEGSEHSVIPKHLQNWLQHLPDVMISTNNCNTPSSSVSMPHQPRSDVAINHPNSEDDYLFLDDHDESSNIPATTTSNDNNSTDHTFLFGKSKSLSTTSNSIPPPGTFSQSSPECSETLMSTISCSSKLDITENMQQILSSQPTANRTTIPQSTECFYEKQQKHQFYYPSLSSLTSPTLQGVTTPPTLPIDTTASGENNNNKIQQQSSPASVILNHQSEQQQSSLEPAPTATKYCSFDEQQTINLLNHCNGNHFDHNPIEHKYNDNRGNHSVGDTGVSSRVSWGNSRSTQSSITTLGDEAAAATHTLHKVDHNKNVNPLTLANTSKSNFLVGSQTSFDSNDDSLAAAILGNPSNWRDDVCSASSEELLSCFADVSSHVAGLLATTSSSKGTAIQNNDNNTTKHSSVFSNHIINQIQLLDDVKMSKNCSLIPSTNLKDNSFIATCRKIDSENHHTALAAAAAAAAAALLGFADHKVPESFIPTEPRLEEDLLRNISFSTTSQPEKSSEFDNNNLLEKKHNDGEISLLSSSSSSILPLFNALTASSSSSSNIDPSSTSHGTNHSNSVNTTTTSMCCSSTTNKLEDIKTATSPTVVDCLLQSSSSTSSSSPPPPSSSVFDSKEALTGKKDHYDHQHHHHHYHQASSNDMYTNNNKHSSTSSSAIIPDTNNISLPRDSSSLSSSVISDNKIQGKSLSSRGTTTATFQALSSPNHQILPPSTTGSSNTTSATTTADSLADEGFQGDDGVWYRRPDVDEICLQQLCDLSEFKSREGAAKLLLAYSESISFPLGEGGRELLRACLNAKGCKGRQLQGASVPMLLQLAQEWGLWNVALRIKIERQSGQLCSKHEAFVRFKAVQSHLRKYLKREQMHTERDGRGQITDIRFEEMKHLTLGKEGREKLRTQLRRLHDREPFRMDDLLERYGFRYSELRNATVPQLLKMAYICCMWDEVIEACKKQEAKRETKAKKETRQNQNSPSSSTTRLQNVSSSPTTTPTTNENLHPDTVNVRSLISNPIEMSAAHKPLINQNDSVISSSSTSTAVITQQPNHNTNVTTVLTSPYISSINTTIHNDIIPTSSTISLDDVKNQITTTPITIDSIPSSSPSLKVINNTTINNNNSTSSSNDDNSTSSPSKNGFKSNIGITTY